MKTMKKVISVALLGAMAFSIAGCGKNYQVVSKKDFTNALEDVCDLDEDDWYDYTTYYSHSEHDIDCYDGDFHYEWIQFDSNSHAMDFFEDHFYDDYEDMMDDKDFDGRTRLVNRDTYGYILLNGECDDRDFYQGRSYMYGGHYYVEDEIFAIVTVDDDNGARDDINTILRALGLPRP